MSTEPVQPEHDGGTLAPWQRTAAGANLLGADGHLGLTIFEEITALAVKNNAINLGQGFPDEGGPEEIAQAAKDAISQGHNQYAPGKGLPALREAIASHQERFYSLALDPETEIIVSTGATEGIAATLLALTEPGDEVLTFEPFYDSYGAVIGLSGATHKTVPLQAPSFEPDHAALEAAFNDRTRVVMVNNPHNPTGTVFSRETLAKIVELATKYDAVIVTDEVYEHLTYGVPHTPVATLPGGAERTITISSAGKTFSFTGWKVGWVSGPAELIAQIRTVKTFMSYSSGTPFQIAVAKGLGMPDEFFSSIADRLASKKDVLSDGLREAGFEVYNPRGTYFVIADAAPLLRGGRFSDGIDLARQLPELVGVAAIPVPAFCHPEGAERTNSLLRFAFCKTDDKLTEGARRLATLHDLA
ncbi:aminotransferase class I/II-fold pyridoxal phosphate-dependent enzyme [Arthrobacter pigmenti]